MLEAADVARCTQCGAYVNAYCDVNTSRWFCSLCGSHNKIEKNQARLAYKLLYTHRIG
ncbi:Sec23/Sec24 zinc finger-containing protein [archaeon]|nr:MAG: Sec23/Sec24 zinc finger-containing protein [archaeon]